jgi:hypothetical protein
MTMSTKLTIVTAAILALFVGNAVARTAHQNAPKAGYTDSQWSTAKSEPNGDFQLQGR